MRTVDYVSKGDEVCYCSKECLRKDGQKLGFRLIFEEHSGMTEEDKEDLLDDIETAIQNYGQLCPVCEDTYHFVDLT